MRNYIFVEIDCDGDQACYKESIANLVPARAMAPICVCSDALGSMVSGDMIEGSPEVVKLMDDREEFIKRVSDHIAKAMHEFISRNDTVNGYRNN